MKLLTFLSLMFAVTAASTGAVSTTERSSNPEDVNIAPFQSSIPVVKSKPGTLKGSGPLSQDILERFPRLQFIGTVNGKSFYIERTKMQRGPSVTFCENVGTKLARFSTSAEYNFVYANTPISDGRIWTSGDWDEKMAHFTWFHEENVNPSFPFYSTPDTYLGLTLEVGVGGPIFKTTLMGQTYFPLCYI